MKSRRKAKLSSEAEEADVNLSDKAVNVNHQASHHTRFNFICRNLPLLLVIGCFLSSIVFQLSDATGVSDTIEGEGYGYGAENVYAATSMSRSAPMPMEMAADVEMISTGAPPPPKAAILKSGMNRGGGGGGGQAGETLGSEFLNNFNSNIEDGQTPTPDKMLIKTGSLGISVPYHPTQSEFIFVPVHNSHATHEDVVNVIKSKLSELKGAYIESERGNSFNHYIDQRGMGRRGRSHNVDNNNVKIQQLSMTLRIPASDYDAFVSDLKSSKVFGGGVEVTDSSFSVQDVTGSYVDAVARINVLASSEQALIKLMDQAETTQDVLNVEKQLRTVINQKESNIQQKNYYEKSSALSTLVLQVNERPPVVKEDEGGEEVVGWSMVITFNKALKSVSRGAVIVADAGIFTAVWSVPVFLAYFTIRKAFGYLKSKKPAEQFGL
ncbi:hypothetical protein TrST_g13161 [Triparma strigata]|uniref:DUF4349 domain-containing protein n=1 Tax=Triparma strigata TaxID=1606541 RepID=A0A9W7EPI0_9STRA|nr:hypothetical protein TrST_g13161 [Triparma strigata]